MLFYQAGTLHEHAARAAGRVEHSSPLRIEQVRDQRDKRDGCEEFPAVMGFLVCELSEEILVDATEDIA